MATLLKKFKPMADIKTILSRLEKYEPSPGNPAPLHNIVTPSEIV